MCNEKYPRIRTKLELLWYKYMILNSICMRKQYCSFFLYKTHLYIAHVRGLLREAWGHASTRRGGRVAAPGRGGALAGAQGPKTHGSPQCRGPVADRRGANGRERSHLQREAQGKRA